MKDKGNILGLDSDFHQVATGRFPGGSNNSILTKCTRYLCAIIPLQKTNILKFMELKNLTEVDSKFSMKSRPEKKVTEFLKESEQFEIPC